MKRPKEVYRLPGTTKLHSSVCARWHTLPIGESPHGEQMEPDRERHELAEQLVKIVFNLPKNDGPVATESLWAEPLGANVYRVRNIPFYLYGFSQDDVVRAEESDGRLVVTGIVDRGGHSTYRIFLPEKTSEERFSKDWLRLGELGCTYERATRRLVAIDVPPHADVYAVYEALENGERDQIWEFEEGHCGHPLGSQPAKKPNA